MPRQEDKTHTHSQKGKGKENGALAAGVSTCMI